MDKNRLGVGIVFSGLDKGLAKSTDEVARAMTRAADAMKVAESASLGSGNGLLAEVGRGVQQASTQSKDAFATVGLNAMSAKGEVGSLVQAIVSLQHEVGELSKSLHGSQDELGKTTEAVQGMRKAASGRGMFADLQRGLSMLSLGRIGSLLGEVKDGISGSDRGFSDMAKNIDMLGAKLRVSLDPQTARAFGSSITSLVGGMGLTGDQAENVSHALINSGANLDEMRETIPMIGTLVGKMGMDASKVAEGFGTAAANLNMSGKDIVGLTKEVFKLQRDYQLTNLVEGLPNLFENAYTNLIKFGKVNKQEAMRTVQSMAKMTAQFQKLGFAQQQAAKMSTDFNDKLSDVREAFLDLEAGLDPNSNVVQDIYDAFGAGGLNATGLMESIKSGKSTNDEIMTQMREMVGGIADPKLKNNTMQRLKKLLGPELSAALGPLSDQLDKVDAKAAELGKDMTPEKAFDQAAKAMGGTLQYAEKMHEAAKEMHQAAKDFAAAADITKGWANQNKALGEINKELADSDSWFGKIIKYVHIWQKAGMSFLGVDAARAQVFTGVISEMIPSLTSVVGLFTIFGKPFKALGKLALSPLTAIGRGLGLVTTEGKAVATLGETFSAAFRPLTKMLSSPFETLGSAMGRVAKYGGKVLKLFTSPMETMGLLFGKASKAVTSLGSATESASGAFKIFGKFGQKYIIGPLTWIFEKLGGGFLLKMLGKLLPAAVTRFGATAASWLGGPIVGGIVTVLSLLDLLADIWPWLTEQVRKFAPGVADAMDVISDVVGGAWAAIKDAAMAVWNGITEVAGAAWEGILAGWEAIKPDLIAGGLELWKGMKQVWSDLGAGATVAWAAIQDGAAGAWADVKDGWAEIKPSLMEGLSTLRGAMLQLWGGIKSAAGEAWDTIKEGWKVLGPALISGAKMLWKFEKMLWSGIATAVGFAWDAIKVGVAVVWPLLVAGAKVWWKVQKAIWKGIAIVAGVTWDLIVAGWDAVGPYIIDGIKVYWKFAKMVWGAIADVVVFTWDLIMAGWDVLQPYLIAGAEAWWETQKVIWGAIGDAVVFCWGLIESGWSFLMPWLIKGFKVFAVAASVAIALIVESVKALWDFYSWAYGNIWKVGKATWNAVAGFAEDAMAWIKTKLDAASKWWDETSKDISGAFSKAWDAVKEGVTSAVKWISDKMTAVKATLADLNPFKGMFESNEISNGMGKMLEDNLIKPFNEVRSRIISMAKEVGERIGEYIPDWVKDMMGGVAGFAEKVKARAAAVRDRVGGMFSSDDDKKGASASAQAAGTVSAPGMPEAAAKVDESGKVIPFPQKPGATATRDMSAFSAEEDEPRAKPTKNQQGAAAAARSAGVDLNAANKPQANDKNFQAIVDAITEERNALVKLLAAILDKDMTVEIKGDMRKFMRAAGAAAADDMGGRPGMNAAVGGT